MYCKVTPPSVYLVELQQVAEYCDLCKFLPAQSKFSCLYIKIKLSYIKKVTQIELCYQHSLMLLWLKKSSECNLKMSCLSLTVWLKTVVQIFLSKVMTN